jgi:hypothetical protein
MSPKSGKRKGAGKPALYDEPMKRVNAMVRDIDTALLVELAGSRSAGIRFLCDHWRSLTSRAADTELLNELIAIARHPTKMTGEENTGARMVDGFWRGLIFGIESRRTPPDNQKVLSADVLDDEGTLPEPPCQ